MGEGVWGGFKMRKEKAGASKTETGRRESRLTSVLFMPLREQGLSLCSVRLFNADISRGRGGRG